MAAGQLYYADSDPELVALRLACKDLCWQYNQLRPSQTEERRALLGRLLGGTGERFHLEPSLWFDYGKNIFLGEDFYSNHNLVILDVAPVTFGDHVLLGPNCGFYTAGHPVDAERRDAGLEYGRPITVGSSVWFGGSVSVMPGVRIGSNVVIAGGSVVVKDIPDNVVAAGNPCRVLRPITQADRLREYP